LTAWPPSPPPRRSRATWVCSTPFPSPRAPPASIWRLATDEAAQARFFAGVDAAFVGDGFTRWVDGQYAFDRPELGLANWQNGRLFGRGGVLSGDGVFTVRTRMRQTDPDLRR